MSLFVTLNIDIVKFNSVTKKEIFNFLIKNIPNSSEESIKKYINSPSYSDFWDRLRVSRLK